MKKVYFFMMFLGASVSLCAQTLEGKIEDRVTSFYEKYQPETMWIHLNAETYFAGEIIWYNAFLSNAPYSANTLSSVAYVELIHGQDVLCRQKLKLTDGVAAGDFTLPKNLSTGYYQIRGYTTWMKNLGNTNYYERSVLIINPENPFKQTVPPKQQSEPSSTALKLTDRLDHISVSVSYPEECIVAILNDGNLFLLKTLTKPDSANQLQLPKNQLLNNVLQAALFDKTGTLILEKKFIYKTEGTIITNKRKYVPRDRMDISIQDEELEKLASIYSVSVKRKQETGRADASLESTSWKQIMNVEDKPLTWAKEIIIFPRSRNTLEPIAMNVPPTLVSEPANATSGVNPDILKVLTRDKFISQISEAYGIAASVTKSSAHRLPYDILYYPKDFTALPTLEDFFVEIVTQVRVRKKKGAKTISIRNNENSNKVYFFPKNPMMVIDGVRTDDPAEILSIDPQEVASIHIAYKLNTLNTSGVASFADNGILAVYTKDGKTTSRENVIYDGFHVSSTFTIPNYGRNNSGKDVVPDLRKQLYWSTGIKGTGKTQLSFYLSDDMGEFVVEVKGISHDGSIITFEKTFEVSMD